MAGHPDTHPTVSPAASTASAASPPRPTHQALRDDLAVVRSVSAGRLRGQQLPALRQAAVLLDLCEEGDTEPAPLVTLLRDALDLLGGGQDQDAAEYLLGLALTTGRWSLTQRRARAAAMLELQPDTFRKKPEQHLLDDIAEHILELLHNAGMRQARVQMEAHRHPADSRLAVQWVERFEAYYRLWTPAYALAADLEAALASYCEAFSEYPPWDSDDPRPYNPVAQGDGYALSALYHYTAFKLEERRFIARHGGLWLASDVDVEQEIADAVYRIGWHAPLNEEEDAWLRRHLADARREETDHFQDIIMRLSKGEQLANEWITFVRGGVNWNIDPGQLPLLPHRLPRELRITGTIPASPLNPEQLAATQVGAAIHAARDYTRLIDEDWVRIADWYRPGSAPARGVEAGEMYDKVVRGNR